MGLGSCVGMKMLSCKLEPGLHVVILAKLWHYVGRSGDDMEGVDGVHVEAVMLD